MCKETDRWQSADRPGDPSKLQAPISTDAPIGPAASLAVSLARLPEVLTVREAAAILRVGRNQLYQAVKRGQFPAVRIGRTIRIPKQALQDLLHPTSPTNSSDHE